MEDQAQMLAKAQATAIRTQTALEAVLRGLNAHMDETGEALPPRILEGVEKSSKILNRGW